MVTPGEIAAAAQELKRGGLVAFPTETVYGLGADAMNADAVAKIFEAKQRPRFDPLIVHVADIAAIRELVTEFDERAELLTKQFMPGPLTLVLPKRDCVPDIVTAGLPTVAVRIPNHPVALDLLNAFGDAIAAPSANPFGSVSPTIAMHVRYNFQDQFPILDGGATSVGIESTILDLTQPVPVLLRPGAITKEEIEQVIGNVIVRDSKVEQPTAPGQLARHYAPKIPLLLLPYGTKPIPISGKRCGCLLPSPQAIVGFDVVEILSFQNNPREIAVNLFAAMRLLERMPLDCIIAVETKPVGLGIAINDRLRRASTPQNHVNSSL